MSLRESLGVLRFVDYRRLWFGLLASMTGATMRNAAMLWHVTLLVEEGERALALGTMGLVRVVPIVVCALFAGSLADAVDRRKLLLIVNAGLLCVSVLLATLTYLDALSVRGLYLMAALVAGASTFDNPARNAFFPMLVPLEQLPQAIALNSMGFQLASVLGPALAGILIASSGVGAVYAANVVSFVVIVALLLRIPADVAARKPGQRAVMNLSSAWQGLRFVFEHPLIRASMLLDFVATFFAAATTLLPVFAQDLLHVGPSGYGLLSSAMAVGSVSVSVLWVTVIGQVKRQGLWLLLAVAGYGVSTIALGVAQSFAFAWICLFFAGAADMVSTLLRQTIRQLETPDELRGRMSGVNLVFFMGGPQLGELRAGLLAQALGVRTSVVSGGIACLLAVGWIAVRVPVLRRYRI